MASQSPDLSVPSQAVGVIPHFFYDVIGRIIPGAFVIVSLFAMFGLPSQLKFLKEQLEAPGKDAIGYQIFAGTACFIALIVGGYFVGFMLSAPAYLMSEKMLVKEKGRLFFRPLTLAGLLSPNGTSVSEQERVTKAFKKCFGFDLDVTDAQAIQRQSGLCSYYVWSNDTNLGQMSARWDAEALACRNMFFAAVSLFLIQIGQLIHWRAFCWRSLALLGALVLAGWFMYRYHRCRQISGRYLLFISTLAVQEASRKNKMETQSSDPR